MKKCPYCAEKIADEAVVCRFCGRELTTQQPIIIAHNAQPQYITKTLVYDNEIAMRAGIAKMAKFGWEVKETTEIHRGWDPGKTCCLGVVFLPLALFGKKRNHYQVIFQKRLLSEYEININLKSKNIKLNEHSSQNEWETFLNYLQLDILGLKHEKENPAAAKLLEELKKDEAIAFNRINSLKAQGLLAKRNIHSYDIELETNEEESQALIALLQNDLELLKTGPKISTLTTAISEASVLIEKLENRFDRLVTTRISNNLFNIEITAPFSDDLTELRTQMQQLDKDLSELKKHKKVQGLKPIRKSVHNKKKEIKKHIRKIKRQELWESYKKDNYKKLKTTAIIVGAVVVTSILCIGTILLINYLIN